MNEQRRQLSAIMINILNDVAAGKLDVMEAVDKINQLSGVEKSKPAPTTMTYPRARFDLPLANISDYALGNKFFMLGRNEALEIEHVKKAVLARLSYLGNHLNIVNDPKSDVRPYAELKAEQFAEWIAKGEPDPFDGRNDDPQEIHRTVRGSMGLIAFTEWVGKSSPLNLDFISVQTAVKERLRFYSRQLYLAIQRRLAELEDSDEAPKEVSGS